MKNNIRILMTNWINLLGIFITVFLFSFFKTYSLGTFDLFQALLSTLILICLYGIVFWVAFIIIISILDSLLKIKSLNNLRNKLVLEWFIISIPLCYWTIKYSQWIFLVAIITFFITQVLRKKYILNLKNL